MVEQFGIDEAPDFVLGEAQLQEVLDGLLDDGLSLTHAIGQLARVGLLGDESAGAVPDFDDVFVFEFAVGLGDGVGIHDEGFGHFADPGELVAGAKGSGFDAVFDLFHELEVDGDAGIWVEAEEHWTV
jgi:hypothetical protein